MLSRIFKSIATRRPNFQLSAVRARSAETGGTEQMITEDHVHDALRKNFPRATYIQVEDMSGGCGAMFNVSIEAHEFTGLNAVNQHRLVNEALKDLIKQMHGIKIQTMSPPEY